jgi:Transglutaminase-like superfamily
MDAVVQEITTKHKTPEEVADALYQYIQNNFAYTAIEVGIGGFKPRFAPQTFQKKYGDCKDLTFLYLAFLRKAGIEAYPALVDARIARSFHQDFPNPTQFNHCIAYLPNIGKGTWVDTTVKNFKLGEVPSILQGKLALVSGGPNQLLRIPQDLPEANIFRMKAAGKVSGQQAEIQGNIETAGLHSMIFDLMQNVLLRTAAKQYVYSKVFLADLPLQDVQSEMQSSRILRFQYATSLSNLNAYQLLLINPLNYRILEKLSYSPEPGSFFLLGPPLRIVLDYTLDLAGHELISAPYRIDTKGKRMGFKAELFVKDGTLHYSADAFFLNGFLSDSELSEYQNELRQFSSSLQRVVLLR